MFRKRKFIERFLEESRLMRQTIWRYKKFFFVGILSLVIVDLLEIVPPLLLKETIDEIVQNGSEAKIIQFALLYLAVALIQGVCRYLWRMYLIRSSFLGARDIRNTFTKHLFSLSPSFYDRNKIGDLMSLATNDVDAIRFAMGPGVLILADALFYFLTIPIAMIWLSPSLTLFVFIPLLAIPFIVMKCEKLIRERFDRVQNHFSKISAFGQENLNGIRVIKAFAREDAQIGKMEKLGRKYIDLNLKLARVESVFGTSMDFMMSLGLVILVFVGGFQVMEGMITVGTFVAFQRYLSKMIWPMMAIGFAITYYQRGVASSKRIESMLSVESEVKDGVLPNLEKKYEKNKIEIYNLSYTYPGTKELVFRDVSLEIEEGKTIAFMGKIGSGKSTLLSLLVRLYEVEPGKVFLDGVDIRSMELGSLRKEFGFVSQEPFLFSDTVTENILYSYPESLSLDEKRKKAEEISKIACVHEDILRLPQGYETMLGERGVNLSGGQKQRLTIARALAKNPRIFIFDDSFSAIDTETESRLLHSLRKNTKKSTFLLASHRISTLQHADTIYVLDEGRIVEKGSHDSLLQEHGIYRRVYEQQKLESEMKEIGSSMEQEGLV